MVCSLAAAMLDTWMLCSKCTILQNPNGEGSGTNCAPLKARSFQGACLRALTCPGAHLSHTQGRAWAYQGSCTFPRPLKGLKKVLQAPRNAPIGPLMSSFLKMLQHRRLQGAKCVV